MRIVDVVMSVPSILLALILAAAIGPGLTTVIIVVIIVYWTHYARLARGEVLAVKGRDFVALAHVVGCSRIRTCSAISCPTSPIRSSCSRQSSLAQ